MDIFTFIRCNNSAIWLEKNEEETIVQKEFIQFSDAQGEKPPQYEGYYYYYCTRRGGWR